MSASRSASVGRSACGHAAVPGPVGARSRVGLAVSQPAWSPSTGPLQRRPSRSPCPGARSQSPWRASAAGFVTRASSSPARGRPGDPDQRRARGASIRHRIVRRRSLARSPPPFLRQTPWDPAAPSGSWWDPVRLQVRERAAKRCRQRVLSRVLVRCPAGFRTAVRQPDDRGTQGREITRAAAGPQLAVVCGHVNHRPTSRNAGTIDIHSEPPVRSRTRGSSARQPRRRCARR